ncbi:retrovirus-related pol polyprotein from transposon TNT 1-94 [Tanacetum coccineum]
MWVVGIGDDLIDGDDDGVAVVVSCRLLWPELAGNIRKRGDDDIDGGSGRSEWSRADRDSQDSLDDEEDTRRSQEYINDFEEEYQARALLAKSKRLFKKGTQRYSSAKATNLTECHKCSKKGHFARDCWSKTSVPLYQSPFQPKLLHSSEHKPELRHTKYFEAKYNKVKAKLVLLSSSASAPSSSSGKNKGLIAKTYDYHKEEVSSDDNEVTEVKALMALIDEERVYVGKESARNDEWIKISMKKHLLPPLEKLTGVEPVSVPKTVKSILKSKSTFKAETSNGYRNKYLSSAPA